MSVSQNTLIIHQFWFSCAYTATILNARKIMECRFFSIPQHSTTFHIKPHKINNIQYSVDMILFLLQSEDESSYFLTQRVRGYWWSKMVCFLDSMLEWVTMYGKRPMGLYLSRNMTFEKNFSVFLLLVGGVQFYGWE